MSASGLSAVTGATLGPRCARSRRVGPGFADGGGDSAARSFRAPAGRRAARLHRVGDRGDVVLAEQIGQFAFKLPQSAEHPDDDRKSSNNLRHDLASEVAAHETHHQVNRSDCRSRARSGERVWYILQRYCGASPDERLLRRALPSNH